MSACWTPCARSSPVTVNESSCMSSASSSMACSAGTMAVGGASVAAIMFFACGGAAIHPADDPRPGPRRRRRPSALACPRRCSALVASSPCGVAVGPLSRSRVADDRIPKSYSPLARRTIRVVALVVESLAPRTIRVVAAAAPRRGSIRSLSRDASANDARLGPGATRGRPRDDFLSGADESCCGRGVAAVGCRTVLILSRTRLGCESVDRRRDVVRDARAGCRRERIARGRGRAAVRVGSVDSRCLALEASKRGDCDL
mmetsp:Transcript_14647/g.45372  ORF Transcript_14647/g.45372 Transcript_14647/m.45372 type:complete len:259 (-) Transcript_14647:122-898(-)